MPVTSANKWFTVYTFHFSKDFPLPGSTEKTRAEKWKEILKPILKDWDTSEIPVVYREKVTLKNNKDGTYKVDSGPWKGELLTANAPYLESMKWNIKQKNNKSNIGEFISNFRSLGIPHRYIGLANNKFGTDKGYPKNPIIPNDNSWIAVLATLALGYLGYKSQ